VIEAEKQAMKTVYIDARSRGSVDHGISMTITPPARRFGCSTLSLPNASETRPI
jgi:hypothetical protein